MPDNMSMEQSFAKIAFVAQVKEMSVEQAKDMLIEFYLVSLEKEIAYKKLIAVRWGMEEDGSN